MDLVVAATAQELQGVVDLSVNPDQVQCLISGVGSLESTLTLSRFLATPNGKKVTRVINIGIAGAYTCFNLQILELVFAQHEIYADFGVEINGEIEQFTFPGAPVVKVDCDPKQLDSCRQLLAKNAISTRSGTFLTVNTASGTLKRGNYLGRRYKAVCENMEGFALARVAAAFNLAFVELRCISNFVEDRNLDNWRIMPACEKLTAAVTTLIS